NDAGTQLDVFTASLMARYRGEPPPENGYQGNYLLEMADAMRAGLGDAVTESEAAAWGYDSVVAGLRDDLGRIGVHFDTWFSERTLHARGEVIDVLDALRAAGHTYVKDDAEWLASEALGDQR